jgi:hypothetical protein
MVVSRLHGKRSCGPVHLRLLEESQALCECLGTASFLGHCDDDGATIVKTGQARQLYMN